MKYIYRDVTVTDKRKLSSTIEKWSNDLGFELVQVIHPIYLEDLRHNWYILILKKPIEDD